MQGDHVLSVPITGRSGVVPRVRVGNDSLNRARQDSDVLRGVARRADQPDRGSELVAFGIPPDPFVALVDRPVIVNSGVGKQGGVKRVVGMMVAEDHVGDIAWCDTQQAQRAEDQRPVANHARVGDYQAVAVADETGSAGHAIVAVPNVKHVRGSCAGLRSVGHCCTDRDVGSISGSAVGLAK